MTGIPQDRRLTCNRFFRHLMFYSKQGFSGRLDVKTAAGGGWSIYMHEGTIIWATGGAHPLRRWRRQLSLATGKAPKLERLKVEKSQPYWDYLELERLARDGLSTKRVNAIVWGTLAEIFFDIVRTFELPLADSIIKYNQPLLPLSELVGVGDGMQVTAIPDRSLSGHDLSPVLMPATFLLQKDTQATWEQWVHLGLLTASPDSAPIISNPQRLRRQTSGKAFQNMTELLDGNRTFRDIALRMKRSKDQLGVGGALAPYIQQGAIDVRAVGDLSRPSSGKDAGAETPILVCIDAATKTHGMMESLAARAGYTYEAMCDGVEAIQILRNPEFPVPTLILVAESTGVFHAPEICRALRRVDRLQEVPIVIYPESSDATERSREALDAGATMYLIAREFNPPHLLILFERYNNSNKTKFPPASWKPVAAESGKPNAKSGKDPSSSARHTIARPASGPSAATAARRGKRPAPLPDFGELAKQRKSIHPEDADDGTQGTLLLDDSLMPE